MDPLEPKILADLLGLTAHDLRNPLSALRTNLGFLASIGPGDDDLRDAVADGLASCDGIAHMIDNVDLISRALRSADRRGVTPVRLGGLVIDAVGRTKLSSKSHEVTVQVADDVKGASVSVRTHQELFISALENLLRNSIQLAPAGSTVRVSLRTEAKRAGVVVHDGGPLLEAGLRESAFTAAGQAAVKGLGAGRYSRGLGLWCARLASDACAARIDVEEPPEGGNAFVLSAARG